MEGLNLMQPGIQLHHRMAECQVLAGMDSDLELASFYIKWYQWK